MNAVNILEKHLENARFAPIIKEAIQIVNDSKQVGVDNSSESYTDSGYLVRLYEGRLKYGNVNNVPGIHDTLNFLRQKNIKIKTEFILADEKIIMLIKSIDDDLVGIMIFTLKAQ